MPTYPRASTQGHRLKGQPLGGAEGCVAKVCQERQPESGLGDRKITRPTNLSPNFLHVLIQEVGVK